MDPKTVSAETILAAARGCSDYGGGYWGSDYEVFQHGIQTVVNVLERLLSGGENDPQIRAVVVHGSKEGV